jgi:hypothetical protein
MESEAAAPAAAASPDCERDEASSPDAPPRKE